MALLYRLLLLAYPRAFRAAHGPEMTAAVEEAWRKAGLEGLAARARFLVRLVADFVRSWPAAWRRRPADRTGRERDMVGTTFVTELRVAWRVFRRHRWSTAATVLTLAAAIGAAAAVFSVAHAVVLRPLPFAAADRLVVIWERHLPRNREHNVVAPANYLEWRDRARSFDALVGVSLPGSASLTGDGAPERVPALSASWDFLSVLGVRPARGRDFAESDAVPTAEPAALLSWSLWQRRYGGDGAVVGRPLTINGRAVRVVGILPRGFAFLDAEPDVLSVLRFSAADREPRGRSMVVLGRLAPDAGLAAAQAEMDALATTLEARWPEFNAGWRTRVVGLHEELSGAARRPLFLLLGAVLLLLLVGCANIANLLLARAAARRAEMSVRAALGASRGHLVRQLFVEGLLLASLGTLGGLTVAYLALRAVRAAAEAGALEVPRLADAALNPAVVAFAAGLTGLCTLVFSLVPAVQLSRRRLADAARSGGQRLTGTRTDRLWRRGLVVTQVAVAVVLVVGAGLAGRTLANLTAVDPGFDADGVWTMTVSLPSARYPEPGDDTRFFQRALGELRAMPGVGQASGIAWLPFAGLGAGTSFAVRGQPEPPASQRPVADIRPVDGQYFDTLGIPIVAGRTFTDAEVRSGAAVAVVNQTMADRHFPGENPVGHELDVNWAAGPDVIVGVVGDVRHASLREPVRPMVYYPYERAAVGFMTFVLRAEAGIDEATLDRPAVAAIQRLDPDLPVTSRLAMADRVASATASPGLAAALVVGFAGVALLLALVGIGGLLAANVAQRESEFGIRLALGSRPAGIRGLVLREAAGLAAAGLVLGLGAALFVTRLAEGLLFEVRYTDPAVYAATAAAVVALSLAASDLPARRASRVDPASALRGSGL